MYIIMLILNYELWIMSACCRSVVVPTDEGGHYDDAYQDVDGRHAEYAHKYHRRYPDYPRPPAHLGGLEHIDHRHADEGYHHGTDALEGLDDIGVVLVAGEEHRHQQDDEEGGQAAGNGGHHAALGAAKAMAGEDGDVDGEESWGRLCQGDDVDKVFIVEPTALHQLALDSCYHGDASTNGEGSNLSEYKEYLPKAYHKRSDFFASAKVQQAERRTKQTRLFFIARRSVS